MQNIESNIERMLIISTAHITQSTGVWLVKRNPTSSIIVYEKGDYGWIILSDMAVYDDEVLNGIPKDLIELLNYAHKNQCKWIMLDCDAPIISELPNFEW